MKGFERRARRADGPGHVDRSGALLRKIIRRADVGADLAARIVDDEDRARQFGSNRSRRLARQSFERGLQLGVQASVGGRAAAGARRSASSLACAASTGKARRLTRHGFALGGIALGRGDHSASKNPVEDHVAGGPRGIGEPIRPPCFRRLRQGHEQGRLADREPLRLAAEIRKARRPHALDIAAIRGKPQVKIEDASLAHPPFDLDRAQNLTKLSGKRFSARGSSAAPPASSGSSRPKRYGRGGPIAARRAQG